MSDSFGDDFGSRYLEYRSRRTPSRVGTQNVLGLDRDDDEQEDRGTSPVASTYGNRYLDYRAGRMEPEVAEPVEPEGGGGFGEIAMRGLRGVAAGLSPVALSQDVAFSITHGILDEDTSVWDNFQEMEWGRYTPWTGAPKRVVTGRDILSSAGVMNEGVLQYGGVAIDLLADPLVFGAYLRGVSKVAGGVDSLNQAANRIDDVSQAMLLGGALPTARTVRNVRQAVGRPEVRDGSRFAWRADTASAERVASAVGSAYERVTPKVVRDSVQGRMDRVAQFGTEVTRRLSEAADTPFRLPGTNRLTSARALFMVDGGTDKGLVRELQRARAAGAQESEDAMLTAAQVLSRLGDQRAKNALTKVFRSQAVHFRDIPERIASANISDATREAIQLGAYSAVDQISPVWALSRGAREEIGEAGEFLSEAERLIKGRNIERPVQEFGEQEFLMDELIQQVRDTAARVGDDVDEATDAFRATVDDIMKADAVLGYQASLFPYLREEALLAPLKWLDGLKQADPRFRNLDDVWSLEQQRDWAARMWRDGLENGMNGTFRKFEDGSYMLPRTVTRKLGIRDADREGIVFKGAQMFEEFRTFSPLDPQTYLRSIVDGHLRRSFGVFNNGESYPRMLERMRSGGVILKNIVDDASLEPENYLRQAFPDATPEEAQTFTQITRNVQQLLQRRTPAAREGRRFGISVGQKQLKEELLREGYSPNDIDEWFSKFAGAMNADTGARQVMENVERFVAERYAPRVGGGLPIEGAAGTRAFRDRNRDVDAPFLESLMESMDPAVSIFESAASTSQAVSRQLQVREIVRAAKQNPEMVRTVKQGAKPGFKMIPKNQVEQYGDLAGKYVHPILYRELNNVMAQAKDPSAFGRSAAMLRSMVTGGYLANPATTATNVLGGFFTAFLYGQNPISLAAEMGQAYSEWRRAGSLPEFEKMGALLGDTLTQADILRVAPDLKTQQVLDEVGSVNRIKDIADNLYQGYQEYVIRKPAGIGALGLQPFEISENLFRVGAYRQARKRGLSEDEAYDYARFMVFDYSAQPDAVRMLRDSGLFLFPSFPTFMVGRTLNAAWNRPGVLAASDRVSEAMWNAAVEDEDEQMALWGGMNDWMRQDQYVPLWPVETPDGRKAGWQFFPLGQMLATNGLSAGAGLVGDQLETAGLWGPMYDIASGLTQWNSSDGTATFGQRYGRELWTPGATNTQKFQGLSSFIYESFAPGFAKKLVRPGSPDEPAGGLLPALGRAVVTIPGEAGDTANRMMNAYGRMPDRNVAAEAFTTFVRSTRAVTVGGVQGQDITQPYRSALFELQNELQAVEERMVAARRRGDEDAALAAERRYQALREEFVREWGPYQEAAQLAGQVFGGQE